MVKASDLLTSGGTPYVPIGASEAKGNGWLIDPDLNTGGVNISTLILEAHSTGDVTYVGSDKATLTNNRILMERTTGTVGMTGIYLAPGEGLNVDASDAWVLFDYL